MPGRCAPLYLNSYHLHRARGIWQIDLTIASDRAGGINMTTAARDPMNPIVGMVARRIEDRAAPTKAIVETTAAWERTIGVGVAAMRAPDRASGDRSTGTTADTPPATLRTADLHSTAADI